MKALSVRQPYAHQIIVTKEKRVENRTWPTNYRGPLAIHAGTSRDWLRPGDDRRFPGMTFGAVIGVCRLRDCINIAAVRRHDLAPHQAWINGHEHTEGPWCFELDLVHQLATPMPYKGHLSLFKIPDHIITDAFADAATAREVLSLIQSP